MFLGPGRGRFRVTKASLQTEISNETEGLGLGQADNIMDQVGERYGSVLSKKARYLKF